MNSRKIALSFACLFVVAMFTACPNGVQPGKPDPVAPSSDAFLASLSVSAGGVPLNLSPGFVKTTLGYSTTASTDTTEVTIAAVASTAGSTIVGTGVLTLGETGTGISREIIVTAQDGTTIKTYTIIVNRAAEDASSDASLSALSVSLLGMPKTLDPEFSSTAYEYTVVGGFPNATSFATITALATDDGASISGSGNRTLVVGDNELEVIVTAADGSTTQTYVLNVERLNPESDRLLTLSTSGLSFAFSPNTRTYALNAPNSLSSTTITATPELSGSTIERSLDGGTTFTPFTSGTAVDLVEGPNTIVLRVNKQYSGDPGSDFYYTLTITRAAAGASTDATLSELTIKDYDDKLISLSPAFNTTTYLYTATIPSWISTLQVTPTPNNVGALVNVTGNNTLSYGSNTITVSVTAADGVTKKTYTITVTRLSPPGVSITSPVSGASIPAGSISVTGTYTDPNDEIDTIAVYLGTATSMATFSGGTYSASLDASAIANGAKLLSVECNDSDSNSLSFTSREIIITGGTPSYVVSMYLVLPDGATSTSGYLSIGNATSPLILDMNLASAIFPLQLSVDLPNGTHGFEAFITDAPYMEATKYLFYGVLEGVVVDGATVTAGTMYLLDTSDLE